MSLDNFFSILDAYKKSLTWALGGTAILPLIASFAGLAPPWPPALPMLTSLATLLTLVTCYQFFRKKPKKKIDNIMKVAAIFLVLSIVSYLLILELFTYKLPTTNEVIYLGCGWSEKANLLSSDFLLDNDLGCPGEFKEILKSAEYEAKLIWRPISVTLISIISVVLWCLSFISMAFFLGSFLVYQSKN